ncbi:MAG TPA: RNA 2',3'-cyclic phosphodiesterase [Dehalococcoidales bacterium]|nr:RNA 2',3'-cyclic phosphodiesterase [Dehalococcoidales bacterium]
MEDIRSFIAVELTPEIKLALARLQDHLKAGYRAPVRWVAPENIHLTLKFLGNVSPGLTGSVTTALEKAAAGMRPLHLEVTGLGVFPNPRRVQIVWVGMAGELESLGRLQQRIESGLAHLGFKAESRPFTPHLTLGRVRESATPDERQELGWFIAKSTFQGGGPLEVGAVYLMRSRLTPEGPVYSRLGSVRLG